MVFNGCPIKDLELSDKSKESISEIKRKVKNMKLLSALYGSTAVYQVLFNNTAAAATVNLTTADWATFARGASSIPTITRKIIKDEAMLHFTSKLSLEQKFWVCVYESL